MAFKPQVKTTGSDKWSHNALAFATKQEALENAYDLMMRWFSVTEYGAVEVDEPATHSYQDRKLEALKEHSQ